MKTFIFSRYVLKEHIGPFIFALSIIIFLFLINFTLKEAGNLFGRGLSPFLILKVFYYAMAPILAMAVPMSVLIATLMAFIRMAADSEITILRSSGISLIKILIPLLLAATVIFLTMFKFMNTVLPEYNVQQSILFREISRLKPTATIYPKTFTELKNVQIYVDRIDDDFNNRIDEKIDRLGNEYKDIPVDHLFDVIIYNTKDPKQTRTIIADEAFVLLNTSKKVYEFILFNGEDQSINTERKKEFQKTYFDKTVFYISASEFVEQETDSETNYKSGRQKSADELLASIVEEEERISTRTENHLSRFNNRFLNKKLEIENIKEKKLVLTDSLTEKTKSDSLLKKEFETNIYNNFKDLIRDEKKQSRSTARQLQYNIRHVNDFTGEWHKKYSIPFAAIIFVLIGAPLGMMTRKGEAGSAVAICLLIFLINHTCMIVGEKMADRGEIPPIVGLWLGHMINSVFAAILLIRLKNEKTVTIDIVSFFKRLRAKF